MRIIDWSSDVFSSDLPANALRLRQVEPRLQVRALLQVPLRQRAQLGTVQLRLRAAAAPRRGLPDQWRHQATLRTRVTVAVLHVGRQQPARSAQPRFRRHRSRTPQPAATGVRERDARSEEHTSELQSLMRISYAVFCLKKKKK